MDILGAAAPDYCNRSEMVFNTQGHGLLKPPEAEYKEQKTARDGPPSVTVRYNTHHAVERLMAQQEQLQRVMICLLRENTVE